MDAQTAALEEHEYYVMFRGEDRRCDGWLKADALRRLTADELAQDYACERDLAQYPIKYDRQDECRWRNDLGRRGSGCLGRTCWIC